MRAHHTQQIRPPGADLGRGARARRASRSSSARRTSCSRGLALFSLAVIALIVYFVFHEAWPALRENSFGIFGTSDRGGPPALELDTDLQRAFDGYPPGTPYQHVGLWPAIYGTILFTLGATALALPFSIFSAIFIAELAPQRLVDLLEPTVRLLAGIPSVIFGLLALLVIAPQIDRFLVNDSTAERLSPIIPLNGRGLLLGTITLFVMVTPIMVAIFTDSLRAVPGKWKEGSAALGVHQWRTIVRISLPVIRPAIVAGTILAMGRAIGEAIAISMASGSLGFSPNPLDGFVFFLEPSRPLASTIFDYSEGLENPQLAADLFACGALIMISILTLSIAARIVSIPFKTESTRA